MLDAVVFEPSRYLPRGSSRAPSMVPSEDERLLSTPYGLLLNELVRSPSQLLTAVISLINLALGLDTGSYFASQADLILYVVRFTTRVENFLAFLTDQPFG